MERVSSFRNDQIRKPAYASLLKARLWLDLFSDHELQEEILKQDGLAPPVLRILG